MFAGIVEDIGTVVSVDRANDNTRLVIETHLDLGSVEEGASIACNGCCLTVVGLEDHQFSVDVSGETLSKTSIADWKSGTTINLERSLKMGSDIDGHLVYGHVDGLITIQSVEDAGQSRRYMFEIPAEFRTLIAQKGSIAIDGVSLTVNKVDNLMFEINVIPYTLENTILSRKVSGDQCHFEIDMLARYAQRILSNNT